MEKKFICKICNKKYKSYQSLWNHNHRFHPNLNHSEQNMSISVSILSHNEPKIQMYKCDFCDREYKHIQSKNRHQKNAL